MGIFPLGKCNKDRPSNWWHTFQLVYKNQCILLGCGGKLILINRGCQVIVLNIDSIIYKDSD